jgi:hypothetical protein
MASWSMLYSTVQMLVQYEFQYWVKGKELIKCLRQGLLDSGWSNVNKL